MEIDIPMDSKPVPDKSTVTSVAEDLSHRWGELQERPPEFIDELMIDLTTELVSVRNAGDEDRAGSLNEILDVLAEGIIKSEHGPDQELEEDTLERAIECLRTYYYLKTGIPRTGKRRRAG